MVRLALETFRNLTPNPFETPAHGRVVVVFLQPVFMMGIDDDKKPASQTPVHHLLHAAQPLPVNVVGSIGGRVPAPVHGNAHTLEPGAFVVGEIIFPDRAIVAPGPFRGRRSVRVAGIDALECVADVDAAPHLPDGLCWSQRAGAASTRPRDGCRHHQCQIQQFHGVMLAVFRTRHKNKLQETPGTQNNWRLGQSVISY